MITEAHRDTYAIQLARHPNDPLKAAEIATGGDIGMSLQLMAECDADLSFAERQRALIETSGVEEFLPSREMVGFEIVNVARAAMKEASLASKDFGLRAYKLYCEVVGIIEKGGGTSVVLQNNITNRVMQVATYENPEQWEQAATAQQKKLIDVAHAARPS